MAEMTRDEWIAKRDEMAVEFMSRFKVKEGPATMQAHTALEMALGPCPPEPSPTWHTRGFYGWGGGATQVHVNCDEEAGTVTFSHGQAGSFAMEVDEADEMGQALQNAARWQRERGLAVTNAGR